MSTGGTLGRACRGIRMSLYVTGVDRMSEMNWHLAGRRVIHLLVFFHLDAVQLKETFSRSSVSCLKGWDLQSTSTVPDDPCWQVTQQFHQLIEKVSRLRKLQFFLQRQETAAEAQANISDFFWLGAGGKLYCERMQPCNLSD